MDEAQASFQSIMHLSAVTHTLFFLRTITSATLDASVAMVDRIFHLGLEGVGLIPYANNISVSSCLSPTSEQRSKEKYGLEKQDE